MVVGYWRQLGNSRDLVHSIVVAVGDVETNDSCFEQPFLPETFIGIKVCLNIVYERLCAELFRLDGPRHVFRLEAEESDVLAAWVGFCNHFIDFKIL